MSRRGMTTAHFEFLTTRARELRHESAPAESRLWERLRDRKLGGYKWRRQQPRAGFIIDFYCAECRLVVELDGDSHGDEKAELRGLKRTRIIERDGLRVTRFLNPDVYDHVDAVLEVILDACNRLADPSP